MDYGKHLYERKKRQKMAAQAHVATVKEIRLRPKTDAHDRQIKLNHAIEFFEEGHKVQFTMLFRGRERFFKERANEIFQSIVEDLADAVKVERPPMVDGRRMTMVLAPVKKKAGGQSRAADSPSGSSAPPAPKPPKPSAAPSAQPVETPDESD